MKFSISCRNFKLTIKVRYKNITFKDVIFASVL